MVDDFSNIIRLTKADAKAAAITLERAFQDYPVSRLFTPSAGKNKKDQMHAYLGMIRWSIKDGEAYATSPKMEGVAMWSPPNERSDFWWRFFIIEEFLDSLFMDKKLRAQQTAFFRYSDEVKKRVMPGKHWHLEMLAVDPDYQGKGFSSRLLRPILARADREGVPCYLDTQLAKNVDIYKHFGFRVAEEGIIPEANVHSWAMVRDAK
jgi:GNAT superfamily N-acetyltransferase